MGIEPAPHSVDLSDETTLSRISGSSHPDHSFSNGLPSLTQRQLTFDTNSIYCGLQGLPQVILIVRATATIDEYLHPWLSFHPITIWITS